MDAIVNMCCLDMFRHAHSSSRNLGSASERVANSDLLPELSPQFVCDRRGTRPPDNALL